MKKWLLCLAWLQAATGFGQLSGSKKLQMDSLVDAFVANRQFSGVVMMAKGPTVIYERVTGYADREKQILNREDTRFNIASMGKTFTATLIMQLVQEGKLRLDQTLAELLPGEKIRKADSIRVYHLLTHSSGVGNYMMHPRFEEERGRLRTLKDVMPYLADQEPTLPYVGAAFDYSNSGFILLGRIIEQITGKSYIENLQQRIFAPLGIKNSYLHYPASFNAPGEAVPYFGFTARSFVNGISEEFPAFSDGGMQSNAPDLLKFANGLLSGKLLKLPFRDSMWKGRIDQGRDGKYAYGWVDNDNNYGRGVYSHSGGGKGFTSDLKIVPADDMVVIVLANNKVNAREMTSGLLDIFYLGKWKQPEKYIETRLLEQIEAKGFDYLRTHYKTVLKSLGYEKTPSPMVYVRLSDMLESLGHTGQALDMIALGREEFPREANLYSVSGNIYAAHKQYSLAREWFNKALAIDPNDGFARMMLKNLEGLTDSK